MSPRLQLRLAVCALIAVCSGCGLIQITERPPSGIETEESYGRRINDIRIEGLKYTLKRVVLRQMYSRVGSVYTKDGAVLDYRYLDQLKVFSSIQLDAQPDPDNPGVILVVTVTENNPYTPSLKVGITDENGVNVGLGGSSSNLMGTALKANASFNVGGQSGVIAGLETPWRAGRLLSYNIDFSWQIRDNMADDFRENAVEINTLLLRNLGHKWRFGGIIDFVSMGSDTTGITLDPDNRDNVLKIGGFIGFDTRDIPRNPKKGVFAFFDVERAVGDAHYWRGNLDLRGYWTPLHRHTLAFFSFNTHTSGTVGQDIAVWDDFHIGGTNTVRGWNYGARVGKNQIIATVEYRYTLIEPKLFQLWFLKMDVGLQLAAFGDAGTAYDTENRPRENFISGAGAGIRLILPSVNMIRFDFAAGQPSIGISLHIGSNSKATSQRNRVR